MPDLHQTLQNLLTNAIHQAADQPLDQADPILRPAKDPAFGDYQANGVMGLAKKLKQRPRDLAERVIQALHDQPQAGDLLDTTSTEVAGPGFINLHLRSEALAGQASAMLADQRLGLPVAQRPQTVVVDYSSPNVAKEMHVGHLRSAVIGDAIARILQWQGHRVIRQNHVGDWGTQFGMLIEHLLDAGWQPGQLQQQHESQIGDLNALYQQAKRKFDADDAFAERARRRVVALQRGDEPTLQLWRDLVEESKRHFNQIYQRLGIELSDDDIRGESFYNDRLPDVIASLDEAGLLRESEGAKVVFLEGFVDREGNPLPMLVQKSDGGYLYGTTDLAAARYRLRDLSASRVIYVTDFRQSQHFQMLFAAVRAAGWADDSVRLDHVSFGAMLGPDRKPFKTRQGETVRLADLLDEAEQRAREVIKAKNPDLPPAERDAVASVVGIGGLKYADLANDRRKDYVFDWDRMLALDGNTAPYLQNAYVRIRSIFRKGGIDPDALCDTPIAIGASAERTLVLKLAQWPQIIHAVTEHLEPNRLCAFLYDLASAYHQFYEQCPVLTADDEPTRQSRLALSHLVARTLAQGLSLLGIQTVEQM